jgi:hypothetical protein
MPRILKTQSQGKVLHNSSPRILADVVAAVETGKWRKFTPPQRGACRRIIHDAIRELPTKYPYPSQTKAFQSEMFRLDLLLTYFDL